MVSKLGNSIISWGVGLLIWLGLGAASLAADEPLMLEGIPDEAVASPVTEEIAEEIPEEILRTEIITGARSPITGEPMTAAEYAQLQAELDGPVGTALVSDDIRYLVFLLQVRRAIRPIVPFIR